MIRFLFRFVGLWLLAGAFVALVIDGTRSVSASSLTFIAIRDAWTAADPVRLEAIQKNFAGGWAEPLFATLLAMPLFGLLGLVGLILIFIGRRKQDHRIGYSSRD